jgi:seryl-tRNA synthetase
MHKVEVARRQIDSAIDLFLEDKDYLSVITLAGAGEEIIGNLLSRDQKKNMIDHLIALDKELTNGGRAFKEVNREINSFKNSLKHANQPAEDLLDVAESKDHAIAMLSRAMTNYGLLKGELTSKMEEFHIWLQKYRPELFPTKENSE